MKVIPQRVFYLYIAFFAVFCLAVFGFWFFGGNLFSILLQRSKAYTPPPFLSWLSLASSLSIAVAFSVMPFSLFRIVRQRPDVPFGWIVLCVAGFLFLCGLGAFIGLLTVWFQGPVVVWSLVLSAARGRPPLCRYLVHLARARPAYPGISHPRSVAGGEQ
jgi:hypothetical protein